ncbi:MAG: DUF1552 domain-containing protein [Myxococcota bacterium]
MKPVRLDRRTLLRGAASTAIALPWLEAMAESSALANNGTVPCRYLVCFGGYSLAKDRHPGNEVIPDNFGALPPSLPFSMSPLNNYRQDFSMVSNLELPYRSVATPGGRRSDGDSFHFHVNPLIAGKRQLHDPFNVEVDGPSSDQVVAEAFAASTVFPSIAYRVQAGAYGFGGESIERATLSFAQRGEKVTPIPAQSNPRQAFDSLVGNVLPSDPTARTQFEAEIGRRRSVLDLVDRRMGGLLQRLGTSDQQRVEQHFAELRDLEMRVSGNPIEESGACSIPTLGSYGGFAAGYSDEEARGRIFADLMTMAFACDLTRVGTLMYSFWQTNLNFLSTAIQGAIDAQLHDITHSNLDPAGVDAGIFWHMGQFAYLLDRLKNTQEGGSSLLDNMGIVYLKEGGHGAYDGFTTEKPSDPNAFSSHTTHDMVVLVAGGANSRLRLGQHIDGGRNHPVQVVTSVMDAVGVPNSGLGEVSGQLAAVKN